MNKVTGIIYQENIMIKINRLNINLYLIMILSFLLRFFNLGIQCLWMDEAVTYSQIVSGNILTIYTTIMHQEGHIGPLSHIITYIFSCILGYSEWALRLPSALFGSMSVLFLFVTAKKMFNEKIALLSAFLLAISPLHIWYSQEARMYSLWVMLMLICFHIFLSAIYSDKIRTWLLFAFFSSLSLWTFLNSIFFFFAMGLFLLINIKSFKKQFFYFAGCMIVVAISYMPGFITLLLKKPGGIGSARSISIYDLAYTFLTFNVGTSWGPSLVEIRSLLSMYGLKSISLIIINYGMYIIPVIILFGSLAVYALHAILTKMTRTKQLLLIMLFIPVFTISAVVFVSKSVPLNIRYLLAALPFYLLFISYGILNFNKLPRNVILFLIIIITTGSLYNHYFNPKYSKINIKEISVLLNKNLTVKDGAIILHEGADVILDYYDSSKKLKKYYISNIFNGDSTLSGTGVRIIDNSEKIFYIKTARIQAYNQNEIKKLEDYINNNYLLIDIIQTIPGVDIKVFR